MMPLIVKSLLALCDALLVPTVLALFALVLLTVIWVGGVLGESLARRRAAPSRAAWLNGERPSLTGQDLFARFAKGPEDPERRLSLAKLAADRALARLAYVVRLGPALGLAGTLIPLGPALTALSAGDVQALSMSLVTAFGTTVVGVVVGLVCHGLHVLRRGWYAQDLEDLAHVVSQEGVHV